MEENGRQIGIEIHWFKWTEDVKKWGEKWRVIEKMGAREGIIYIYIYINKKGSDSRKGRDCNLTITYLYK